ncbi:MAG: YitT family protein [Oscillospiraceae bacterium]|nr:YitT family protein [Oscillospiraceae bacterium]
MKTRRILMSLAGVLICAVSVGIFKIAALGVDPFQSLMSGLDNWLPIPFGTLYVLVNLALLVFSLVADRRNIGIATFINLFLLGYITQFTYDLLQLWLPNPSLAVRILCLVIGIVVICFGSSLYMTANLGVSTYDAVAIVLSDKWKWGQFQYIRICCDLVCVILGVGIFLLSGGSLAQVPTIAGIGTIITAFFMGPLIQFFNDRIAKPMLKK